MSVIEALTDSTSASSAILIVEEEGHDDQIPIILALKRALKSVTNTALLIDSSLLVIFLFGFGEYTQNTILGRAIPFCRLFTFTHNYNDEYWKNLKVISKECIISQCAWATCIFAM
jgi:hypothetical protein